MKAASIRGLVALVCLVVFVWIRNGIAVGLGFGIAVFLGLMAAKRYTATLGGRTQRQERDGEEGEENRDQN